MKPSVSSYLCASAAGAVAFAFIVVDAATRPAVEATATWPVAQVSMARRTEGGWLLRAMSPKPAVETLGAVPDSVPAHLRIL
jgi:hypothetical protein